MAKAVRFHAVGGPEVLQIEYFPLCEPGSGEIAIKVAAVGLNRADDLFFHGGYLVKPDSPAGLGLEAAGTVTAIGLRVRLQLCQTPQGG